MAGVETGGEEAILAANINVLEGEADKLLIKDEPLVEVRLFGEGGELIDHTSKSVHFYAMMCSMRADSILLPSTLASDAGS